MCVADAAAAATIAVDVSRFLFESSLNPTPTHKKVIESAHCLKVLNLLKFFYLETHGIYKKDCSEPNFSASATDSGKLTFAVSKEGKFAEYNYSNLLTLY